MTPAKIPNVPMVTPTVTKIFIIAARLAPIVRRMAMSRVLARTSMIREERMLNTATNTISERTTNIAIRSTSKALKRAEFIWRQSTMMPWPRTTLFKDARVSPTLSGSLTCISIMPTWSPIIRRVWASSIGMTT